MENYKSLVQSILVLLSVVFIMSSCDDETADGKARVLKYDDKSYALTYGTMHVVQLGSDSYDYVVELWDATKLLSSYKGELHMLYFRIHGTSQELQSGTYQLKEESQGLASAGLLVGTAADPKNARRFEFKSGEIVVQREGDKYKFTIKLIDTAGKVADGYYQGILVEGDSDGGWDD